MLTARVPRLSAVLGMLLLAAGLGACNNDKQQTTRRYCDTTGCYSCVGDQCYPVAGDPSSPDVGPVAKCDDDAACGTGRVCNLGKCEASCKDDAACASGASCVAGRCRPGGAAQCGVTGAFCTDDAQCGTNRRCVNRTCGNTCAADANCAKGQTCQSGVCQEDPAPALAQCQFDLDCGAQGGYRCVNAYCLPKCSAATQCSGGAACVKGLCRADRRGA